MSDSYIYLFFFFVVLVVIYGIYLLYFRKGNKVSASDKKYFLQKWKAVSVQADFHMALLDADKLLELGLKKKGYSGSLGENLKKSAKLFSNVDQVWTAHKLRNRIAHEIGIQINAGEAKKALQYFQKALQDLGFL